MEMEAEAHVGRSTSLESQLAAKSSRVAELEARVALLEAENARLREAMARAQAAARRAGEERPKSLRLEEDLGGSKQKTAEKLGAGDGEEEVIIAADYNEGRSRPEEGAVAFRNTRSRAAAASGESEEDEDDGGVRDVDGGGDGTDKGIGCSDGGAGLEDDDVSVTVRGSNKRVAAARVVTSDSEDDDEDVSGGELGSGEDEGAGRKRVLRGVSDSENEDGENGVHVAGSRCAARVATVRIESEDEDDTVPISRMFKKMRKESVSDDDGEPSEAKGCSAPMMRRSARLLRNQSKEGRTAHQGLGFVEPEEQEGSDDDDESSEVKEFAAPTTRRSSRLHKNQSKGKRAAHQGLRFVDREEQEGSEDDMEEDDDMDEFINDEDSSENASNSDEEPSAEQVMPGASAQNEESAEESEESDGDVNYEDVMTSIRRKRKAEDWKFEGDMLAAFDEDPELCVKAVCAIYRKQTQEEQSEKATFIHNKQGFRPMDAFRGSRIAEFVLDGDVDGPLMKTVDDLEEYDHGALEFCRGAASRYSKQLFAIYQNKEDPYFLP